MVYDVYIYIYIYIYVYIFIYIIGFNHPERGVPSSKGKTPEKDVFGN